MAKNDVVLLDKVLEAGRLVAPSHLKDDAYFELFAADQVLKEYELSTDELLDGLCAGGNDGGVDGLHAFADIFRYCCIEERSLARAPPRAACHQGGELLRDDPDDPMRTAMRQMVGGFAQLDRRMIVARLRRGKRLAAEEGKRVGGRSPYG